MSNIYKLFCIIHKKILKKNSPESKSLQGAVIPKMNRSRGIYCLRNSKIFFDRVFLSI